MAYNYQALLRRKLLEEIYDKLSEEDKRTFVQLTLQDKRYSDIMQAIQGVSNKVDENKHSFASDLLANIAGNGIFDGVVWLGSKLLKK